jgi:hypothetical protein
MQFSRSPFVRHHFVSHLLYANAQKIKELHFANFGTSIACMSDMIRKDAAQEWRQLCQAAFFELNPVKLLERIAVARNAILDRVEDTKPNNSEQYALRKALETLSTLRELAERDIGELKKTIQTQNPNSGSWGRIMERHNREQLRFG